MQQFSTYIEWRNTVSQMNLDIESMTKFDDGGLHKYYVAYSSSMGHTYYWGIYKIPTKEPDKSKGVISHMSCEDPDDILKLIDDEDIL